MSKNTGMGRKRIDNRNSKGLGKCAPNSRGEQCGNAVELGCKGQPKSKGKFEWDNMKNEWEIMKHTSNPFEANHGPRPFSEKVEEELKHLAHGVQELEDDLEKIKEKFEKLRQDTL